MTATAFSTNNGATSTTGTTFATAALYNWTSGLGVVNSNENPSTTGPHATDNKYGTDAILLQFSSAVSLTNLSLGWTGTTNGTTTLGKDSDFSLLAYTSTPAVGATASSLVVGKTLTGVTNTSTLLSQGWYLVGNYADVTTGSNQSTTNTVYSSYWLISAYNGAFGTTSKNGGSLTDSVVDYFKLASVTAQAPSNKTPEPGSLALMGIAMAGFVVTRRRKQKAA